MNCMNCGAFLADKDLDYCPHCGCNVLIQKKVEYLSKLYYNQGLEKASNPDPYQPGTRRNSYSSLSISYSISSCVRFWTP